MNGVGGEAYGRGGDETVSILPGLGLGAAEALAEQIRSGVHKELEGLGKDEERPQATVSIGVVTLQRSQSATAALKAVDDALYRAKGQGKDRVVAESAS